MNSQSADLPERGSLKAQGLSEDVFAPSERDRIVQAMATTCAERGYREASIEEVVERAGVPLKVFEENFSGKEQCALAAMNLNLSESVAAASAAYSADTSEWESIVRGVRAMLELWAARPSFANMGYIQSRQTMPKAGFDLYVSGIQVMASMVDRLGAYSTDDAHRPQTTARGVLGGAEILIRRELAAGRPERIPELLPDIIYGALTPFLGQEEALRYARRARELHNDGG